MVHKSKIKILNKQGEEILKELNPEFKVF